MVETVSESVNPTEKPELNDSRNREHIRDLALVLFDRTEQLHALSAESRTILDQAALWADTRLRRAKKKPYQFALDFTQTRIGKSLNPEQQRTLAAVIAFQQGKLKRKNFGRLELSSAQQREVLTLTAILRIAEGLDHSGSGGTAIRKVEPSESGMWIVVDGPTAAADAEAAQQRSRLWAKIGYPEVEVLESAEADIRMMPFPEPMATIGIMPGDPLAEAGRKVMRFHFAQMLRHEDGTRQGEDIEALHDMRVATRRLRAAFEVFGQAFEPGDLKPHLKGLRATGRALGSVRDLDVFMEKAQKYLSTLPEERRNGLAPLLDVWKEQREAARAQMLKHLDSREYADFKRKFNIFLNTPGAGARLLPKDQPVPQQVCHLVPVLIYTRMASVRSFEPLLRDAPIELLHALRIEIKKLRYSVEYFREVLGKQSFEVIEDLKMLQDHLGDLNDAQVASLLLREFIDNWAPRQQSLPIQEHQNIEEVVSYLEARQSERHDLLLTFPTAWEAHFHNRSFRRKLAQAISVL